MSILSPNFYYFVCVFALLLLFAFLFKKEKAIPKFLRSCSLFLLLSIIFEPVLRFISIGKPEVVVLVDTSRSMGVGGRLEKLKYQISKIKDEKRFRKKIYGFDAHLYPLLDSITVKGELTSIGNALLEAPSASAYILLSDGLNNYGPDPISIARARNIPIYTIKIADSTFGDIRISSLSYNKVAYTKDEIPINVRLEAFGYNGQKVKVLLKENNRILQKKEMLLSQDSIQIDAEFSVTPQKAGLHLYKIVVSELPDEINSENNAIEFGINVLKSRIKVCWLSDCLSWNFKFAKLELAQDNQIELDWYIKVKEGGWLSKKGIINAINFNANYDVVILDNFDYPEVEKLINKGTGLIIIGNVCKSVSPLILGHSIYNSRYPIEVEAFNIFESESLPPLKEINSVKVVKGGSKVLCKTHEGIPVIVKKGAVIGISATDVWRWNFAHGIKFWSNLIKLIAFKGPALFVDISPVINVGERVIFKASAYTEIYTPDDECDITVNIIHANDYINPIKLPLYSLGNGKYEGAIEFLSPGKYRYEAITEDGVIARGEFKVDSQLEFQRLAPDEEFLRTLSSISGGKYIDDVKEIDLKPMKSYFHFNPSYSYFSLVLIILLMSLEWFYLRK